MLIYWHARKCVRKLNLRNVAESLIHVVSMKIEPRKFPIIQSIYTYILAMSIYVHWNLHVHHIIAIYIIIYITAIIAWTDPLQKCWLPTCNDHNYSCIIRTSNGHWFQTTNNRWCKSNIHYYTRYRVNICLAARHHCISVFIIVKKWFRKWNCSTSHHAGVHACIYFNSWPLKVIYIYWCDLAIDKKN